MSYKSKWAEENKERVQEHLRRYREKNKEKIKKYNREWRRKNKDKRNAQAKREYDKKPEHYIAKTSAYLDRKNPSRIIRRIIKQFRAGDIDRDELIKRVNEIVGKLNETSD